MRVLMMRAAIILILSIIVYPAHVLSVSAKPQQDTSIVFDVDIMPQFKGGVKGWLNFIQNTMDISQAQRAMDSTDYVDYGLRQTAVIEFTVCADGQVCDPVILNKHNISPEFAKEALRVINKSPMWTPAIKDGKAVRTRFKQSITAVLTP